MGKGIPAINGIATKSVISALLVGSMGLKAATLSKNEANNNAKEVPELVSKAGADALKAASLQGIQQTSVVHNERLDNTFRKFATNENEKKQVNSMINAMYANKGTFVAAAQIQHELDRQQLYLLLEEKGDLLVKNGINPVLGEKVKAFGPDFYKSVRPNAAKITEWLDKSYSPAFIGLLSFDNKMSGEEILKKIDEIADKKSNFTVDDLIDYHVESDNYRDKVLKGKKDNVSMSEFIAFKVFTIDRIVFQKTLKNANCFGKDSQFAKYANLEGYYEIWMNSVNPIGK